MPKNRPNKYKTCMSLDPRVLDRFRVVSTELDIPQSQLVEMLMDSLCTPEGLAFHEVGVSALLTRRAARVTA